MQPLSEVLGWHLSLLSSELLENIPHGKEIWGIGVPTSTKNMKNEGSVEVQKCISH